ncbi:LLM class flavin-dependent oxidoreductase [Halobacteriales archaeon QS_8_69_26]|nr:MAG: LLM class flavin-dependent oxidoreductase [Halobacteriales archaeon QS_8_69_26]
MSETGFLLPEDGPERAVELATRAEDLGYDSVWVSELWGEHSFVQLTELAHGTDEVDLGTAIVNVYSRTPAVLAMAVASLSRVAGDRVRLGVGTSTPKAVEDLHGMGFESPVRRTHEAIELVEAYTAGEGRVEYEGEVFDVADFPALDADVPVYNAALGPANRRATGRVADGWLPHNVPFADLGEAFETVADAAREAGRDPEEIRVAPYAPAAVADDAESARAAVRGHLAYYVGSAEAYERAAARRFPGAAAEVAEHWRSGDREAARAAVTDAMVEGLSVAGTPAKARDQLADLLDTNPVDEAVLVPPVGADDAVLDRTLEALAP